MADYSNIDRVKMTIEKLGYHLIEKSKTAGICG